MTQLTQAAPDSEAIIQRERLLRLPALMTFIIFFQAYWSRQSFPCYRKRCKRPSRPPE
ncbi:hypothetical protein SAMN05444161_8436 [Rhizobiales bacterium GAS191]|nr:hypothetical protein SAMN05444161_8436 [Rhizobiales bacterium GAS191]